MGGAFDQMQFLYIRMRNWGGMLKPPRQGIALVLPVYWLFVVFMTLFTAAKSLQALKISTGKRRSLVLSLFLVLQPLRFQPWRESNSEFPLAP